MSLEAQTERTEKAYLDDKLGWMLDHPFFVDASRLAAFYDAVIQPKLKAEESIELVVSDASVEELNASLGAEFDLADVLGSLGAVLSPLNVSVGAGTTRSRKKDKTTTQTLTLEPIETPQRQLIQLTSQYLVNYPDRIFFVDDVERDRQWAKPDTIQAVPREVVFLDLPTPSEADEDDVPETKLIPMAVEFENGDIEMLHDKFKAERRGSSWEEYIEEFDPYEAVEVVEEAMAGREGKVEWINFRLPLDDEDTARIHFEPDGRYNNGTFAYNLVRMGYEHGLRIVGTVNREPDVRVLAGYVK